MLTMVTAAMLEVYGAEYTAVFCVGFEFQNTPGIRNTSRNTWTAN